MLRCLVIAIALSAAFVPAQQPVNLVTNASFEDLDVRGDPTGWRRSTWGGKPVFTVETGFGRTGERCVKVSSTTGADASWSFEVEVQPQTRYRLSAWIKVRGLDKRTGYGALLNLHQLGREGRTPAVSGDQDWTRVESTFESGPRRRLLVNVLFGGFGRSVGEAWFDDVELVDLTPPLPVMTEAERATFYREKVHPILERNCAECHGPESRLRGGLFLGSREGVLSGGESGPAVSLDAPRDSLLLRAVKYEAFEMPPTAKLRKEDVEVLTLWARLGVPFDPSLETPKPEVVHESTSPQINEETRAHWAFQPVERPLPPVVADKSWVANPLDAFVLAELERAGLRPAPRADRQTLIRRVYHDVIGLPPTPEEVSTFLADRRPDAWERVIDRLLASPHYGERWGRHWLDVVRYAETNSFERDGAKPLVWKYRDWVIRSLNEDKPYDQMILEQLAGDELDEVTADTIIATGYYRLGQWDDEPADPEQALFDDLDDIVATTAQAFLGLTMNCARCHDHKLDPIPQQDYYRMLAFMRNIRRYGVRAHSTVVDASVRVIATDEEQRRHADAVAEHKRDLDAVMKRLAAIESKVRPDFVPVELEEFKYERNRVALIKKRSGSKLSPEEVDEYGRLTERRNQLRRQPPRGLDKALCVKEHGAESKKTHVLIRGNPHVKGKLVEPGFPRVLGIADPAITPPKHGESTGRRLAFARWVASRDNPLTARVMVNRVFQHHFGRPIVRSPNNFGLQGRPPTHPRLLDWLASEFVAGGYRLKRLHRLILTSSAWKQAYVRNPQAEQIDPSNELLWRFDVRRLSAEEVRDSILAVTGRLNRDHYGPSVFPKIPRAVLAGQSRPGDGWRVSPEDLQTRRSVYVHVKRSLVLPVLATFDVADTDFTCPVRFTTNQPTQALSLMNGAFANEQARAFARDLLGRHPDDLSAQIELALWRVLQRQPRPEEVSRGKKLCKDLRDEAGLDAETALTRFCVVALNLNEFMYLR